MDATRIASLLFPAIAPELAEAPALWSQVDRLRSLVREHLPPVTAALFTRARAVPDQPGRIEWYSDLAGEPVPLDDLSNTERTRVLALTRERLNSVLQLAERVDAAADEVEDADTGSPGEVTNSDLLRRAACYPNPSCIYTVAGEPVLTYWGIEPSKRRSRNAKPIAELPRGSSFWPPSRALVIGVVSMLALVLLLALGVGVWHWYQQQLGDELADELRAGLAEDCETTAILQALQTRLMRIDPEGTRFPEVWNDTNRELDRCADAEDLEAQLDAAESDCSAVPAIAAALTYHDVGQPPFDALNSRVSELQVRCDLAEALVTRLHALGDDCDGILHLEQEQAQQHPAAEQVGYPLAHPLAAINAAAEACRIASDLRPALAQAIGNCQTLRAVERELDVRRAQRQAAPAPLAALQAELDQQLERCALADDLTARLAEAQGDCVELASLRELVTRQHDQGPPFERLVGRLDEALRQCAALNDLELRFVQAQGNCKAIANLSSELQQWRDNLRFVDIRARVNAEEAVCAEASALEGRIAEAGQHCDALRALESEVNERAGTQFAGARQALKAKLDRCALRERLASLIEAAGSHCGRLKAAQREIARESGADLAALRQRLEKALAPCRPKPKPKPTPESVIAKPPRGAGTYALSGACNGSLVISPAGGYHRDPVRHIVSIAPPVNARIAKVVSDNRGCRNCRLKKRNATTWSVQLYYGCSGRGNVPIAYSAYDANGKLVCSGRGVARCLGRRRP